MAWDDTKAAGDDFTSSDWNAMVTDQEARVLASSGAGVPSSTPDNIGDVYVDTSALRIYIATGTSTSSDWKKVMST